MIVYGKNVLEQLKQNPEEIEELYFQEGSRPFFLNDLPASHSTIPIRTVSRKKLDMLTSHGVHQGMAAKVKDIKGISLQQMIAQAKKPGLFLMLDHIQDPQNLGAILRSADAAGVDGVIVTRHESASLTPSAIKASTGAAYHVPLCFVNNLSNAIEELKKEGYWIVGTDFEGARDYREGTYEEPTVLVIGNEGKGISQRVKKLCDYKVMLPMKGSVSSLNASVATGILLYEINAMRDAKAGVQPVQAKK